MIFFYLLTPEAFEHILNYSVNKYFFIIVNQNFRIPINAIIQDKMSYFAE